MKAVTLKHKIFEMRSGQYIDLIDDAGTKMTVTGEDDGWMFHTLNESIVIKFDDLMVKDGIIGLIQYDSEGEKRVCCQLDPSQWEIVED